MSDQTQYLTQEKVYELEEELRVLKQEKIPALARRIDDARSMGDLSENAEYHAAREDMSWAQTRVKEIRAILDNAQLIQNSPKGGIVQIGSTISVKVGDKTKTYAIVGAQEADPLEGKISNESPLGSAFLGKRVGDTFKITVPSGTQSYEVLKIE